MPERARPGGRQPRTQEPWRSSVARGGTAGDAGGHDAARRSSGAAISGATFRRGPLPSDPVATVKSNGSHVASQLGAGIDTSTIALWLGHEQERTTHVYLHADLALKQRTLDRIAPPTGHPGRYHAPDSIIAFLDNL